MEIDLNKPAFGEGSQKLEDLMNARTPDDTSVEETAEDKPVVEEENVDSVEENKVPYSRFKTIHNRAKEAEAEAEMWRQRVEEIESSRTRSYEEPSSDMPSEWKELYGDSEASEKAWKIQQRREELLEQRAYEAGQRGAQELEIKQQERIEGNLATLDENFDELSDYVGRQLSEKEQAAILDIVDDFTPKDNYGRYAGPLIPFEKAWEMYELKNNSGKSQSRNSRNAVASLSGTNTQGDTSIQAERDKSFNPLDWNSYKNRL